MKILFDIWIISGILSFVCVWISPYVFFLAIRGHINFMDHLVLLWQQIGGKIVIIFLNCILLGPIALIKVNLDAYNSIDDLED